MSRPADDGGVPPIPADLAHLPVLGGLAVPVITPQDLRGRYLFGQVSVDGMRQCIEQRLCGVCGRPHTTRLVLLMRLRDLPGKRTVEPPVHPQCSAYTTKACPMVGGRMDHYRSSPARLDAGVEHAPDTKDRLGAPAEQWFAVWLSEYRAVTVDDRVWASYEGIEPLRVRPIGGIFGALYGLLMTPGPQRSVAADE